MIVINCCIKIIFLVKHFDEIRGLWWEKYISYFYFKLSISLYIYICYYCFWYLLNKENRNKGIFICKKNNNKKRRNYTSKSFHFVRMRMFNALGTWTHAYLPCSMYEINTAVQSPDRSTSKYSMLATQVSKQAKRCLSHPTRQISL